MRLVGFALVLVLAVCGCSDHDRARRTATEAADRTPRVLDPPAQNVRALPPHAIRRDGVGPYRLGLTLEQLGTQVPSGGRTAQIDILGVVHLSVLHAEDDAIQIGGEPLGRASFVAIVADKIARTESGIQVGSTREDLIRALGRPDVTLARARDPRIVVPSDLRELRAVIEDDRVAGLVVTASEPVAKLEGCTRPAPPPRRGSAPEGERGVVDEPGVPRRGSAPEGERGGTDEPGVPRRGSAPEGERGVADEPGVPRRGSAPEGERGVADEPGARGSRRRGSASGGDRGSADGIKLGACFATGTPAAASPTATVASVTPAIVTIDGDELVIRAADSDRPIDKVRLTSLLGSTLVFAAPVRAPDGKDEIVAITRIEDGQTRTWSLVGYRVEAGKLVRIAEAVVYQLTATNARWIGSTLRDLDLLLEVTNRGDTFEVGGLLTHRTNDKLRDLLALSPVQVAKRRARAAPPEPDRDVPDAGAAATAAPVEHHVAP